MKLLNYNLTFQHHVVLVEDAVCHQVQVAHCLLEFRVHVLGFLEGTIHYDCVIFELVLVFSWSMHVGLEGQRKRLTLVAENRLLSLFFFILIIY